LRLNLYSLLPLARSRPVAPASASSSSSSKSNSDNEDDQPDDGLTAEERKERRRLEYDEDDDEGGGMHEQREMTTVQVKVNKWEPLEGTKPGEVSRQKFLFILSGSRVGVGGAGQPPYC